MILINQSLYTVIIYLKKILFLVFLVLGLSMPVQASELDNITPDNYFQVITPLLMCKVAYGTKDRILLDYLNTDKIYKHIPESERAKIEEERKGYHNGFEEYNKMLETIKDMALKSALMTETDKEKVKTDLRNKEAGVYKTLYDQLWFSHAYSNSLDFMINLQISIDMCEKNKMIWKSNTSA